MNTHLYKYIHAYSTHITTSERLSRLNLEIYEVSHRHQQRIAVDRDIVSY
jgi:hypothetical protein